MQYQWQCIAVHIALCIPDVGEESAPSKRWFVSGPIICGSEKYQSASVCKYAVNVV